MIDLRKQEKAFLVGIMTGSRLRADASDSLSELRSLCETAGAIEVGSTLAEIRTMNPGTLFGKGKVGLLKSEIEKSQATLVIVDTELLPSQNRNLEEAWNVRVMDRTGLILDIFALHAKSMEGKLQVELAQYEYLSSRLVGAWGHFSKQRGGSVGLRGPGETQLEVDRRRVRERMARIKKALSGVSSTRQIHRQKREGVSLPTVTLVGYTNAGKSTLFNKLTGDDQLVEDKLFATLDPKTKILFLPSGQKILLADTVGFIRNLPHQLIEAFKSTFEEVAQSSLLLHVIDAAHPNFRHQIDVVESVLEELDLDHIPVLNAMNKRDEVGFHFAGDGARAIPISARTGKGLSDLLSVMDGLLMKGLTRMKLFLPHPYGSLLASLYEHGRVFYSSGRAKGMEIDVALPPEWSRKFSGYSLNK